MSRVIVSPDGKIHLIYSDELRSLLAEGPSTVVRASHVEPTQSGGHGWTADLSPSGGPVLGPFETRAEALAEEVKWLETNRL